MEFIVEQPAPRLDRYLCERSPDRSRAEIQRWIREGHVLVNARLAKPGQALKAGDRVQVSIPATRESAIEPEPIALSIVYEDEDIIVVDKPAGMVVHPAAGHASGTLVNAILHHCPELAGVGGVRRPGIVHRLDKDTSGLILVAKNDRAHRHLQAQFKARAVEKIYLALVHGRVEPRRGRIDAAIGRHRRHRQRMAVLPEGQGRSAQTDYEVIAYYREATLVEARPLTGRTHQIRVHFASIGRPLVGDELYGLRRDPFRLGRHFLHAHRLRFRRPRDESWLSLASPLPAELTALLHRLEE